MFQAFLFATPYTPRPKTVMEAPYGVMQPALLKTYGEQTSSVRWTETAQDAWTVQDRKNVPSGGFHGPLLGVSGQPVIAAGNWRTRDAQSPRTPFILQSGYDTPIVGMGRGI